VTNEDNNNRIIKGVMAVAIVGSATLLALGNPRASLGAMAVTGASAFFRRVTNEDNNNRIIKGVMAVAIVGSATLLALGNPHASLGAMAVTCAGIAAG
jgi:uncharacterized membrane protein YjfL (UPF0719 family)